LERKFFFPNATKIWYDFDVFRSSEVQISNLFQNRFHAKAEARAIAKEKAEERRALADAVR